jgi:hypothetical protein
MIRYRSSVYSFLAVKVCNKICLELLEEINGSSFGPKQVADFSCGAGPTHSTKPGPRVGNLIFMEKMYPVS